MKHMLKGATYAAASALVVSAFCLDGAYWAAACIGFAVSAAALAASYKAAEWMEDRT